MLKYFKDLGNTVLQRWKQKDFALARFPEIARAALEEFSPAKSVDLSKMLRDFLLSEEQPFQTDSEFGEPEIVAYSHPRFYIQILFWLDGTTAIHQHGFSGAFHVMRGSSIHAHFSFDKSQTVTPGMRIGNLQLKKMEILETGTTAPIISGPGQIHSLFHLDLPSISMVIRTQHDSGRGPQLNYLPPHVAIDPLRVDLLFERRMQVLDVLEQGDDPAYEQVTMQMISESDFETGFHLLRHCRPYLLQIDQWPTALATYKKKHGKLTAGVAATLAEESRRSVIKSLRSEIENPEHRFFLALLMNANKREDLFALIAKRFKGIAPMKVVMRWAEELTESTEAGIRILDAYFPSSLTIDPDEQLDVFLSALEYFMRQEKEKPPVLSALSAREIKTLQVAFADSTLGLLIAKKR